MQRLKGTFENNNQANLKGINYLQNNPLLRLKQLVDH